jgi:hypothetical protein
VTRMLMMAGVALALGAVDLAAQTQRPIEVEPGTRVRVTSSEAERRLVGGVAFIDADSLVLTTDHHRTTVSTASIQQLDVSRGRHWLTGALKGAAIGTLTGGAVFGGLVAAEGGGSGWTSVGVVAGMIIGLPTGFVVGGLVGSERWEHRYPTATDSSGGLALGFTIRH